MMMKQFLTGILALLGCAWPALGQEVELFNGRDLTGWKGSPAFWIVEDGAITALATGSNLPPEQTDLVWMGGEVADFEFRCKVKMAGVDGSDFCNTGVYFRCHLVAPGSSRVVGYQADLVMKPTMPTVLGALVGEVGGVEKMLTQVGQRVVVRDGGAIEVDANLGDGNQLLAKFRPDGWNGCLIVVTGRRMQFYLNGVLTSEAIDQRADAPQSGLIALQLLARKAMKAQFKDLTLRHPAVTSASGADAPRSRDQEGTLPPIQTDPNQPRIEVIRDQGPNAVEWALAPLEEPTPPNIRQNLTYRREDLLDEAKAGPKAPAEAYTLGSDYCDKILAALRLREQARVQAGYRAAQADADIKVTNSQLDARRNYQMSWPQYHREESQRAALREQETNKADLKKEKVKVEWAARADQMRVALDAGYRQFREAMR